ncbi:MAG: asparagine synthase-related protein [Alphaproteobacteria bacterium]
MCSFIFSSLPFQNGSFNDTMKMRGPDHTAEIQVNNFHLCHNLLSMRGDYVAQPFRSDDEQVIVLLNGEIYNCPDHYASEVKFLYDQYCEFGCDFFKGLDGEYSIVVVDFKEKKVVAARDCFGTKPLFFGYDGSEFGFASYRSALTTLGFSQVSALTPNRLVEYSFDQKFVQSREIYHFNIAQYKTQTDHWEHLFDLAVAKRTKHLKGKPFVGLSSGYDSGAIAASLLKQKLEFLSLTITGREDADVISQRVELIANKQNKALTYADNEIDRVKWAEWLSKYVEDETYLISNDSGELLDRNKSVCTDTASLMLAFICSEAKEQGARVYLSGSGADEIYSDYGHDGKKFYAHSNFGGKFPDNLLNLFPWKSFFGSTQAAYLTKEEMVAGSFGMEARYPFLDRDLVQEFLVLDAEVKNEVYKSVICKYLENNNFPYKPNAKIGFGFSKHPKRFRLW